MDLFVLSKKNGYGNHHFRGCSSVRYMYYRRSVPDWELTEEREHHRNAAKSAENYREKYLNLRKMMRDYFKDNNIVPDEDVRKAIGMK